MPADALAQFAEEVYGDPDLQRGLAAVTDRARFVRHLVQEARARGLDVAPDDVEDALQRSRREWFERWV